MQYKPIKNFQKSSHLERNYVKYLIINYFNFIILTKIQMLVF